MFQSTHPCGVRPWHPGHFWAVLRFQSTHPCGVRLDEFFRVAQIGMFQSTHPCGVRPRSLCLVVNVKVFQSTHPCGVRLVVLGSHVTRRTRFNPRTPAGCDIIPLPCIFEDPRFQSTHPCGVRLCRPYLVSSLCIQFQSTHPCGVRPASLASFLASSSVSIHAPLRGATIFAHWASLPIELAFQSTHPCGVRLGLTRDITLGEL